MTIDGQNPALDALRRGERIGGPLSTAQATPPLFPISGTPEVGDVLMWNGDAWVPGASSGGGSGGLMQTVVVNSDPTPSPGDSGKVYLASQALDVTLPANPSDGVNYIFIASWDLNSGEYVRLLDSGGTPQTTLQSGDGCTIVSISGSWWPILRIPSFLSDGTPNSHVRVSGGSIELRGYDSVGQPVAQLALNPGLGLVMSAFRGGQNPDIQGAFTVLNLPTSDPHQAGRVWLDTSTGNVKISAG